MIQKNYLSCVLPKETTRGCILESYEIKAEEIGFRKCDPNN